MEKKSDSSKDDRPVIPYPFATRSVDDLFPPWIGGVIEESEEPSGTLR